MDRPSDGTPSRARRIVRETRAWRKGFFKSVVVNGIGGWAGTPQPVRAAILRRFGVDLGLDATVAPGCWFGGRDIAIGEGSFVNRDCLFDNSASIVIGRHCAIGQGSKLLTSSHEIGPSHHRAKGLVAEAITIEDGVWIGASVTVLPGVSIGKGCVVAAGAVVSSSCQPNGVYGGVPSKKLRDLAE